MLDNGIWSAFHRKSSAHLWWWDSYIHTLDLYQMFTPLAFYSKGEDLAAYALTPAPRVVSGADSYLANPGLGDFYAVSTQVEFTLQNATFPGTENLSQWHLQLDQAVNLWSWSSSCDHR